MKSPAFQFYPTEYLGSQRVSLMTLEEEGAYIRLLSSCWVHGSIPADPSIIARLIGKGASTTLATTLATMFQPHPSDPSRLVHDRLDAERAKQSLWREKSREGGKKSAKMREKAKGGSTTVARVVEGSLQNGSNQKSTLCLQSLSSSLTSEKTPPNPLKGEPGVSKKPKPPLPEIPEALAETPGFPEIWSDWITARSQARKPLTPKSAEQQLDLLSANRAEAVEMVRKSINSSWTGIFPLKSGPSQSTANPPLGKYRMV